MFQTNNISGDKIPNKSEIPPEKKYFSCLSYLTLSSQFFFISGNWTTQMLYLKFSIAKDTSMICGCFSVTKFCLLKHVSQFLAQLEQSATYSLIPNYAVTYAFHNCPLLFLLFLFYPSSTAIRDFFLWPWFSHINICVKRKIFSFRKGLISHVIAVQICRPCFYRISSSFLDFFTLFWSSISSSESEMNI
jgi:hypothetical protein